MKQRTPARRLLARLFVLSIFALLAIAAQGLVQTDAKRIAIALGAVILALPSTGGSIVALAASLVFGEWAVAGALGLAVVSGRLGLSLYLSQRKTSPAALIQAAGELPDALVDRLRTLAGDSAITTWSAVDLARTEDPDAWQPLLGDDPGRDSFDGPLIQGAPTCSQFFAEAAAFGAEMARASGRELDADVLAVASSVVPNSLAAEWVDGNAPETILQMSPIQLRESLGALYKNPAAVGFIVRIERELALPSGIAERMSREQLAALTRKDVLVAQVAYRGLFAWAVGAVLWGGVRSVTRWRPAQRRSKRDSPAAPANTAARAKRARSSSPSRSRGPWKELPPRVHLLWLVVRPALAVGAVATAIVVDGSRWWAVIILVASVFALRALRSPLPSLVVAGALAVLMPIASLILAARVGIGEIALRVAGRRSQEGRRAGGMAKVVEARRRLAQIDQLYVSYADAHARFEQLAKQPAVDHEDLFTAAGTQLLAAWCEARPVLTARAVAGLLMGGVFGRWEGRKGPVDFSGEFRRLFVRESVGGALLRLGCVLVGTVAAVLAVGSIPWALAKHGPLTLVPACAGALAIIAPASRARPSLISSALAAAAVWLLLREQAVTIVAISACAALAASLLRTSFGRRTLEGPAEEAWPPPKSSRGAREVWLAADEAARDGRVPLAIQMLDELARHEANSRPELADEATARIALWLLDDGRVGDAAARLDSIVANPGERASSDMSAAGNYAVGMLSSHLGDDRTARDSLTMALEQARRRPSLARRIALSLAELHARLDDAEGALQTLEANPLPRVGSSGMAMVINREVVAASALERAGDRLSALKRIEQVTRANFSGDVELIGRGGSVGRHISSAEGRANLLGGRLLLDSGQHVEALPLLEKAARLLLHDSDAYLRAGAQILHGRALAFDGRYESAVGVVSEGLQTLEERRGQLSSSQRRTALIVAGEDVYEHALKTFASAADSGHGDAGLRGFALIESLRRSAISVMLRSRRDEFRREINDLVHDLEEAPDGASLPARVQSLVGDLISKEAANAFLPSPVDAVELQRAAARNGHILAFYVAPASGSTWQGWMTPSGRAQIRKIDADDDQSHPLGRLRGGSAFTETEVHGPWDDCGTVWSDLGGALFPEDLQRLVSIADPSLPARILIVPDGYLAGVPWSALDIGGAPLVRRALLQIVPTVDLAGSNESRPGRPSRPVLAFAPEIALRLLRGTLPVEAARRRSDFVAALDAGTCTGVYIGTHGELTGLDQRVQLGESEWLSAAGALMHPWPDWVIFAACVVGQIDPLAGGEPLGLPISCMLGGSSSVIAAVVRITGEEVREQASSTTDLFVNVVRHLVGGMAAATALRTAQLAYLEANGAMASVGDGLGAVCLSTQSLSERAAL